MGSAKLRQHDARLRQGFLRRGVGLNIQSGHGLGVVCEHMRYTLTQCRSQRRVGDDQNAVHCGELSAFTQRK